MQHRTDENVRSRNEQSATSRPELEPGPEHAPSGADDQRPVHRSYARNADVALPALEEYEHACHRKKVIKVPFHAQKADAKGVREDIANVAPGR